MVVQTPCVQVFISCSQKEGPLALASPSVKLRRIHRSSVFRHCHCLQQSNCQGRPLNQNLNQQFYLMCPSQIILRVARRQRWWWSWFSRNLREEAQPWHSEDYRSNHHWDPASIYLEKTKSAPRNTEIIFWNTTAALGNILNHKIIRKLPLTILNDLSWWYKTKKITTLLEGPSMTSDWPG